MNIPQQHQQQESNGQLFKAIDRLSIRDLRLFVATVDLKSFSFAAAREKLTKSTVSRCIQSLEAQLGVRLLERNPRLVIPTEVGRIYYEHCSRMLEELQIVHDQLWSYKASPIGSLRICVPNGLTSLIVTCFLPEFAHQHPGLNIEVISGTFGRHLLEEEIDVMIHIGRPENSSYVGKLIGMRSVNYYIGSKYIEESGGPTHPYELVNHSCIVECCNSHDRAGLWKFQCGDEDYTLSLKAKYKCDSSILCRMMVENGLGIALLPDEVCRESLERGLIEKAFGGRYQQTQEIYAIYSSRHHMQSKVRVFLDSLQDKFRDLF